MDHMVHNDFWVGRSVFITGASGFIGGAITRRMRSLGARVSVLVRDPNDASRFEGCDVYIGNVTDHDLLRHIISYSEVDTVFHTAANAIVRVSARDPMSAYDVNIMGTVALLEAARSVGRCRRIIVASSDKAYGDHEELPYRETHALRALNTYDASKACMDIISQSYAHNYAMPIAITRCSNVYGPGDGNMSRIIPNTITRIAAGKRPILYSDIEGMEREFIFIDDVVDAYVKLGMVMDTGPFNVGGTGPVKIRHLVESISHVMGRQDLTPEIIQRDPIFLEIERQYIDAFRMESLGWKAMTSLSDGLDRTVRWYTSPPECR